VVFIPRRAKHASYDSPWHLLAKQSRLEGLLPSHVAFRACFSLCEMARTADAQKLIGCLYTLRDYSILTCRFHGTAIA
jgi:hypothetical protein